MEKDDLKNILARLKPELGATLDGEPSTPPAPDSPDAPPAKADEPAPEGKQWVDLGDIAGRVLIDDPQIQPENDHPAEDPKQFRPWILRGKDSYDERFFAIPAPRWPEQGAAMTSEVWQAYHAELGLCAEANNRLREYCYWLTHERLHLAALPLAKETDGLRERADRSLLQDAEQRAAEYTAWLTGLWQSRGIPVLTGEELEHIETVRKG